MARLGGLDRRLRRLGIAHLADEDHVRVLAQRAAERLEEREGVEPDLALVDDACRSSWRISIGSSIVTMWHWRVALMWPITAASVVDFPTRSRRCRGRGRAAGRRAPGSPRAAGAPRTSARSVGITRNAKEMAPRWRKALTRRRGKPGGVYATSSSPVCSKVATRAASPGRTIASTSSSCDSRAAPSRRRPQCAVVADDRRLADLQVHVTGACRDSVPEQRTEIHANLIGRSRDVL